MTDANHFAELYAATEQSLRYAIGVLDTPEHGPVPVIQLYQPDWDRELLAAVRSSLAGGVELTMKPAADGTVELQLSTRQRIEVQHNRDGQTFMLRAPAWDAQLAGVALAVAERFKADGRRVGSFALVLRTPAWACMIAVHVPSGRTVVGAVEPYPPATPNS